ncbi:MAG: winged helix-turn-helix transcriptional regulator [Candidatus Aquicultor sp.]
MGTILFFSKVKHRARAISKELESIGHEVIMTSSLAPSLTILTAEPIDVIVLDLLSGVNDIKRIIGRVTGSTRLNQLPLVALIDKTDVDRIETTKGISEAVIEVAGLIIDPISYEVTIDGTPVQLTYKEFELLKFLASNQDTVYARQTLVKRIWKHDYDSGMRTVDVHIRRLRAKLGKYSCLITTVRHVGYRFSSPVSNMIFS